MLPDFITFKLFNHNDCWIITREKIASSWLVEQFEYKWNEFFVETETYNVTFKSLSDLNNEATTVELQQKFLEDWNNFKSGKNHTKNFIFLTKNPIHRFISAWIQDFIMRKIYNLDEERNRLLKYFNKDVVDKFIQFAKEQSSEGEKTFPDVSSLPAEFEEIYEEFCFPRDFDFFNVSAEKYYDNMNDTHTTDNLLLMWEFLFDKRFNTNNKLHIIDIDFENLENTLQNKFSIPLKKEKVFDNSRGNYLKSKSYKYLSNPQHRKLINSFLFPHLLLWFNIIYKIYFTDACASGQCEVCGQTTYDHKKIKVISNYKKKYCIPYYLDVFDLKTHITWWKYLPKDITLTYT
jgi:hypothetical protein